MPEIAKTERKTPPITCLFVAFELSKKTWVLAVKSPVSDKISQYQTPAGTRKLCWS